MSPGAKEPRESPWQLLSYLDPLALARGAWVRGRRGLGEISRAPGPNARFFILSCLLWTIPLALTNSYKSQYLSALGLSNLAIGGFFALDMGARVFGVLLGAGLATRFGFKNILNLADLTSWIIPTAVLALAQEPWQVYLASVFSATNALVMASVQQFVLEDTPGERRHNAFAMMNLVGNAPLMLLPALAGRLIDHAGLVPAMRGLLAFQILCMGSGIVWRHYKMEEAKATQRQATLREIANKYFDAAALLRVKAGFLPMLLVFICSQIFFNLWQTYFGLYVEKELKLPFAGMGDATVARSAFFVLGSLLLVPLFARAKHGLAFALCLNAVGPLMLTLHPGREGLVMLSGLAGFFAAAQAALLMARLSEFFPEKLEGMAYALSTALALLFSSLAFALCGALFETRFSLFPWVCVALSLFQAALAWGPRAKKAGP